MSHHCTVNPQYGIVLRAWLLYGTVPSFIHWPRTLPFLYYSSISTTELRAHVNVKNSKLQSVTNMHRVHRNSGGIDCLYSTSLGESIRRHRH